MNFKRLGAVVFVLACLASLLILGLVLAHWERARRIDGETPVLSAQAVITKSKVSQSSASVTSGSSGARLLPGDALILDEGPTQFTSEIAKYLRTALLESGVIRSVMVRRFAANEADSAAVGTLERGPAFFFRIADRGLEIGGMVSLHVKGKIEFTMGTSPWASDHSYQTTYTPPRLEFHWSSLLDADLQIQGVGTNREDIAARALAKSLAESVQKQLQEWQKKNALMPELPPNFFGRHRLAPPLELPAGLISAPLVSYNGLLSHNETFWTFRREGDVAPLYGEIRGSLEAAGWQIDSFESARPYLRASRGLGTLVVFPARSSGILNEEQPANPVHVVQYRERFSDDERNAALDELLTKGDSDALWAFERMMTPAQREKLLQTPATTPRQYLQLARIHRQQNSDSEAEKALRRASALAAVQMDDEGVSADIRKEFKELTGNEDLPVISEELLRDSGFVEITAGDEPSVSIRRGGEPAYFFYRQKNGKLRTFMMVVKPASGSMDTALQFVSASDGGKSSSLRGGAKDSNGNWRCDLSDSFDSVRMSGFAEEAEEAGTYRLSARLVDDWAEPAGQ